MTATVLTARRRWLADEASRLDASCYASGALEARDRIRSQGVDVKPLSAVADVFAVSLRYRQYVRDPTRGARFLASSDLALADPPHDLQLSCRRTPRLDAYIVAEGWSLISSTGTVGNVIYVRPELAGSAVSQDAIRVRARNDIASGYLFAFLCTSSARSMIAQRTYGTTVDRIHPEQLVDLPVPLADEGRQARIHELVEGAAAARTEATQLLDEACAWFDRAAGPMPSTHEHARAVGIVPRFALGGRLDAFNHVGWAAEGEALGVDIVRDFGTVWRPGIIVRVPARRGVPFISGIDAYQVRPSFRQRLRARDVADVDAVVRRNDVLVQRSGQRYGLLGRPSVVSTRMDGWAASEDLMRIRCGNAEDVARVVAFLRSEVGRRALLRKSYGTSIPHFNQAGLASLRLPRLPEPLLAGGTRALALREQADLDEEQAIQEVESWLA